MTAPDHDTPNRKNSLSGNAIVEYILPGGLIVVAIIGGLSMLSGGLAGTFSHVKEDMQSHTNSAKMMEMAMAARASQENQTKNLLEKGNSSISISDLTAKIQTMGANGGTETLADALDAYIAKLKASGELSDDQLSILQKLANEGHNLANAEKLLEDAASSGQGTVTYNGQTYSLADFAQQFGFDNSIGIDAAKGMDPSSAKELLKPFMDLYSQANASGVLSDPAVQAEVGNLSTQIAALSDLAKWNYNQDGTNKSYAYVTALDQLGIQDPPDTPISTDTHGKSGDICGVGSGSDSGTQCSGG